MTLPKGYKAPGSSTGNVANNRGSVANNTDEKIPSYKGFLGMLFAFFLVIELIIAGVYVYFWTAEQEIRNNANSSSKIFSVVSKFEGKFSDSEINATKYGEFSEFTLNKINSILEKIKSELFTSGLIILVAGLAWSLLKSKNLKDDYGKEGDIVKDENWLDSSREISSSTSAAVSVMIAIIGGISLLSPGLAGGFVFAGLISLIICVMMGILVHAFSSEVVKSKNDSSILINKRPTAIREGLISIQFLVLLIGISLLIIQTISL